MGSAAPLLPVGPPDSPASAPTRPCSPSFPFPMQMTCSFDCNSLAVYVSISCAEHMEPAPLPLLA